MAFVCRRCGNCCRWPGCVKLRPGEFEAIAAFLGIAEEEFSARFTLLSRDRQDLVLAERADGSCIFLESSPDGAALCAVEPVKPRQCRDFPERWNFPDWRNECHGVFEESDTP